MQKQENNRSRNIHTNSTGKEVWQTPEIEVLPVPDLTKGGSTPHNGIEVGAYKPNSTS